MLRSHQVVDGETITAKAFRIAMRRVAASVHLLSVSGADGHKGMTASAVHSLSFEPLSLIVCVNKSASIHDDLLAAQQFCVNVLAADQSEIARQFSSRKFADERFTAGTWVDFRGTPALADAQSNILCDCQRLCEFGTHSLFAGCVVEVRTQDVPGLMYREGQFYG